MVPGNATAVPELCVPGQRAPHTHTTPSTPASALYLSSWLRPAIRIPNCSSSEGLWGELRVKLVEGGSGQG